MACMCRPRARKNILVLDDNRMLLKFWDRFLGRNDYQYTLSAQPLEALTYLTEQKFDIVISDIVMPSIDGFDFAEAAWIQNPELTLILTTAYDCDFAQVALGAKSEQKRDVHVLFKPYLDIDRIEDLLRQLSQDTLYDNAPQQVQNENLNFHMWRL